MIEELTVELLGIIIYMTIGDLYTKYTIPPNLQEHMISVATVAKYVCDHWKTSNINPTDIIIACLLHDMGNIVKFDLIKYPHFLGKVEQKRIKFWVKVKQKMIDKFGTDDHEATHKVLEDAGISSYIIKLVNDMSPFNAEAIVKGTDWNLKIMLYADLRVGPMGIIPLKTRLDDIFTRLEKFKGRTDIYDAAIQLDQQINNNCLSNLTSISLFNTNFLSLNII